jgi:hypothetical protein
LRVRIGVWSQFFADWGPWVQVGGFVFLGQ